MSTKFVSSVGDPDERPDSGRRLQSRAEVEAKLRRLGALPDEEIDLAEAALLLASLDRPRVGLGRYRDHLAELARETAAGVAEESRRGAAALEERIAAINKVLYEDEGYQGDHRTYDDLQNANLIRVIDRRRGLPVALAILYIHCARAQGWQVAGLNFPGHFLLRLEAAGRREVVDPFDSGSPRSSQDLRQLLKAVAGDTVELEPRFTQEVGSRAILLRLQNNIKMRLLQQKEGQRALEVLDRMLMLAPESTIFWRESGLLNLHLENLVRAGRCFEALLELSEDPREQQDAAGHLQDLRRRLN